MASEYSGFAVNTMVSGCDTAGAVSTSENAFAGMLSRTPVAIVGATSDRLKPFAGTPTLTPVDRLGAVATRLYAFAGAEMTVLNPASMVGGDSVIP